MRGAEWKEEPEEARRQTQKSQRPTLNRESLMPIVALERVDDTISPLTHRVKDTSFHRKFKLPTLDTYNRTKNPLDHLITYKPVMKLHIVADERLYNAFSSTLKKSAMLWFQGLRKKSINSFIQLNNAVLGHFSIMRAHRKLPTIILTVKQNEGESLWEYNTRFNKEGMTLPALDEMIATISYGPNSIPWALFVPPPFHLQSSLTAFPSHTTTSQALQYLLRAIRPIVMIIMVRFSFDTSLGKVAHILFW
ncbi:hypothetical protein LguiB_002110 [Lonicera macranthoides]